MTSQDNSQKTASTPISSNSSTNSLINESTNVSKSESLSETQSSSILTGRMVFVQNPIYPNTPSLLRHLEHRANYYKNKFGTTFYLVTGTFSLASIIFPVMGFRRNGRWMWINALLFGFLWDWVCFSRDIFGNTVGLRKWYLPNDFYVRVPKNYVEQWKAKTLEDWKNKNKSEV